jgi:hypothetical protein
MRVTRFAMYDAGLNTWRATVPAGSKGRQLFVNGRGHNGPGSTPTARRQIGLPGVVGRPLVVVHLLEALEERCSRLDGRAIDG